MSKIDGKSDLSLPEFVTATSLGELLGWANSIKRQFRKAAQSAQVEGWSAGNLDEDVYEDVLRLLAKPAGASQFEDLVCAFDEKRRGLARALGKQVSAALGREYSSSYSPEEVIPKLLVQGENKLASWITFHGLAFISGHRDNPDFDDMVELVESEPSIRLSLGKYWSDWLKLGRASPLPGASSDADGYERVLSEDDQGRANDEIADGIFWGDMLGELTRAIIDSPEPSAVLLQHLETALERLRPVVARAAEREAEGAARLEQQADEQCQALEESLARLSPQPSWRPTLLEAARGGVGDAARVKLLTECAAWARDLPLKIEPVELERKIALDRVANDDSEDAEAALAAANGSRRRMRELIDREAANWSERLTLQARKTDDQPADAGSTTTIEADPPEEGYGEPDPAAVPDLEGEPSPEPETPEPETPEPETPEPETSEPVTTARDAPGRGSLRGDFPPEERASAASPHRRLVQDALSAGRYGLAAHLQRAIEAVESAPASESAILEALCIGSAISATRLGTAEARYANLLPRVLAALGSPEVTEAQRLLAFAGAIKPALFSSQTSAAEAIREAAVGSFGSGLHELAEFVVDQLPKRGGVLDLASLRPEEGPKLAADELERIRAELLAIADGAPSKKAVFQRATVIWRDLFIKEGPVSRAIGAVRRKAHDAAELAQAAAEELEGHLDNRVRDLDRSAKRSHDAWLVGKALEWLLGSLRDLCDLFHGYATAARRTLSSRNEHAAETLQMVHELVAAALNDAERCAKIEALAAACEVVSAVLSDIRGLLAGQPRNGYAELSVDALLDGELLLFAPYPAAARRRDLSSSTAMQLLESAEAVMVGPGSYREAFERLIEEGRFDEAAEAANRLAATGEERSKLVQEISDARLERLSRVEQRALKLRVQLDDLLGADTEGLIDPASSVQLEGLLAAITAPPEEVAELSQRTDFPAVDAELQRLVSVIEDGSQLLMAPLRAEIDALEAAGHAVEILRELAEKRELSTLRESVDGVKDGAEIDLTAYQENLLRAFAEPFLDPKFALPEARRPLADLLDAAHGRRDAGVVDFSLLAEEEVPAAEALLGAWQRLKRSTDHSPVPIRELLAELRFTNVKIKSEGPLRGARRYSVSCDPTLDRRDCPVPAFGSAANGRLEVLVVEVVNATRGEELHALVKTLENSSTLPTLVLIKGVMPVAARIGFMREARRSAAQVPCGLLDEAGILFLASWPGRRRSDFFAVALPGGGVQPYSDASGMTSPEMFFGRSSELGEIWRPDGSCLVFGGRQLGKTALLEQVRLRYHKPPGQVVVYGSLQGDIDLWRFTASLLKKAGVPVKGHSSTVVEAAILDWLGQDNARRILVLVDEADTYLESEMQRGYSSLTKIRDLMQATERRCKFVFAGLHNVQRLARAPNSPLLHFGTPLRIGPLFGPDLGEAREMVVGPMAAAGIVFDNPTLPNRILSAVGFYPSLMQTFGATLIERVNKIAHGRLKPGSVLPIVVAENDIQNALEDQFFKENIQRKFRMTLTLDERYRLITLAMLQRSLDRREQASIAPSLSDVEVQALAREWWPQGFEEDSSLDAFQGLLQEMVGLGVLVASGDRYAIRSSRIAAMLGGKEQIERELVELSSTPGPQKLDTGSLRRVDWRTQAPFPLTFRQEGQILGANGVANVHLMLGSRALGLDKVAATLMELQDEELAIETVAYKSAREFNDTLRSTGERMRSGRRNLLVLSGPWLGREMIDSALVAASRRSRVKLRVLLTPDWVDWEAVDEIDENGRLWGADLLSLSPLGRSGLGQWLLRTRGVTENPQMIDRLRTFTGGYPLFLSDLGPASDILATVEEAHEKLVSSQDTLASLGLDDERLRRAADIVAQFEPDDLVSDLASMGIERADKVVGHLERLGVLERTWAADGTRRTLNPFVGAVLARQA